MTLTDGNKNFEKTLFQDTNPARGVCKFLNKRFEGKIRICFHLEFEQVILKGQIVKRENLRRGISQVYCNTLQHTATYWNILQHTAIHCNTLPLTATHCGTLQHTATHSVSQSLKERTENKDYMVHCNTLQHTATHCNTLHHPTTQSLSRLCI